MSIIVGLLLCVLFPQWGVFIAPVLLLFVLWAEHQCRVAARKRRAERRLRLQQAETVFCLQEWKKGSIMIKNQKGRTVHELTLCTA